MPLILDPNLNLPSPSVILYTGTHYVRGPGRWFSGKCSCCVTMSFNPKQPTEAQYSLEHPQSQHCGGRQAGPRPWWPASWVNQWALGSVKTQLQNRVEHSREKFPDLISGLLMCTHRQVNLCMQCALTQRQRRSDLYQVIFLGSWMYLVWVYCSDFQIEEWLIWL